MAGFRSRGREGVMGGLGVRCYEWERVWDRARGCFMGRRGGCIAWVGSVWLRTVCVRVLCRGICPRQACTECFCSLSQNNPAGSSAWPVKLWEGGSQAALGGARGITDILKIRVGWGWGACRVWMAFTMLPRSVLIHVLGGARMGVLHSCIAAGVVACTCGCCRSFVASAFGRWALCGQVPVAPRMSRVAGYCVGTRSAESYVCTAGTVATGCN